MFNIVLLTCFVTTTEITDEALLLLTMSCYSYIFTSLFIYIYQLWLLLSVMSSPSTASKKPGEPLIISDIKKGSMAHRYLSFSILFFCRSNLGFSHNSKQIITHLVSISLLKTGATLYRAGSPRQNC